ncbi:hypothetical protein KAR91_17495 [Candidatus Pacearchaeota archaeon]|nr:hypothetical protein [Candidatus Pacearchaeota archaeon]
MYTKGIRKILIVDNKMYGSIDSLTALAQQTGHKAVLHNGQVWVDIGEGIPEWFQTPFTIDDFKGGTNEA